MSDKQERWLCGMCKSLLGFVEGNIVRVKRKDLYAEIEGGKITVICRRCGKSNTMRTNVLAEVQEAPEAKNQ